MGTPDFAVESLNALAHSGHKIVTVVTVPDKPQGRGLKIKESPVKNFAQKNNLSIVQPEQLNDKDLVDRLKKLKADCFVVVAFRILPDEIFQLPRYGTINVHASLLPKYRGAAPINWAIMNGEKETGVTTIFIEKKVDTGNILLQEKQNISDSMTAGELHDLLAKKGAELLLRTLEKIEKDDLKPIKQNDLKVTKAPKINAQTALINFDKTAVTIHNQIRGLSPYPAAYTFLDGKKLKILKSTLSSHPGIQGDPGSIRKIDRDFFEVNCIEGSILIYEVQIEGKRRMSSKDFLNGYPLNTGTKLGK